MKSTMNVRGLALVAALLGAALSPLDAWAQSALDASEAEAFLGAWTIALDTEFGSFDMDLKVEDQEGKVAASLGAPQQGAMADVTDITRSGEGLVLAYEIDAQGQLFPVSVTLMRDGEGLTADFDFGGQFSASGVGTRADG
jgi:hypothetical protein